jgi:hypothetical protein
MRSSCSKEHVASYEEKIMVGALSEEAYNEQVEMYNSSWRTLQSDMMCKVDASSSTFDLQNQVVSIEGCIALTVRGKVLLQDAQRIMRWAGPNYHYQVRSQVD